MISLLNHGEELLIFLLDHDEEFLILPLILLINHVEEYLIFMGESLMVFDDLWSLVLQSWTS